MSAAEILGQLLIGWLIADLVGGFVHWWEDRAGEEGWPLIGPWVIRPNRLHHVQPLAFTYASALQRNAPLWVLIAALSAIWLWLAGFSLVWLAATIGGLVSNEVHRLAHTPMVAPGWARVLQDTGLIQSPKHHAGHHRPPADRRYCILTDWLNPVLDGLKVWARLEAAMTRVGLAPNRGER